MSFEWCHVRYETHATEGEDNRVGDVLVDDGAPFDDGTICVRIVRDGETLQVLATAHEDVTLHICQLGFHRAFSKSDRILLNGYQSWTDTVELSISERMRGLSRVPKTVVDRWTLDGGGDYSFVEYTEMPGRMHGFTYMDIRNGWRHELLGSLGEDDGFTLIYLESGVEAVVVDKECPCDVIAAGEERSLCRLALLQGACDQVYDRWFELMGIRPLKALPLVGYSSWYRHYGDINALKLIVDLKGFCRSLSKVNCEGLQKVFQVDDGYCAVGDWTTPNEESFPDGLAPLAERIRNDGLLPGIWAAPFVCERQSCVAREHPDWLLRDEEGNPVSTGSHWSGGLALDTLNPDVRDYVVKSLRTLTKDWGFGLVKADFLYAACMRPHGGKNRGQLMADAMDLLRHAVGSDVLLLGCGVPLGSAFGRVEYCRIGCDVGLDWDDVPHMRLLHRERVSTRKNLANTIYRAPLDGRAFVNDPDVFFLRDDVKLSSGQKQSLLATDAAYGGMLLTSDDMDKWGDASRSLYQAAVDVLRQRKGVQ